MNNIENNKIYFDNIENTHIEEFKNNLETLKNVNYQLVLNQQLSNTEIIDLYKDLFIYFFFSTYDDYTIMLKNTNQYISSSFVSKYFIFKDNELKYIFTKNAYIIVDSGYVIFQDINNYEIQLKLDRDTNYLWNLKPIIKNNRLYYFIQYIGSLKEENRFISIDDIKNIKINIYTKNLIDNNILLNKNEIS